MINPLNMAAIYRDYSRDRIMITVGNSIKTINSVLS